MSRATPQTRDFARRLIADEAGGNHSRLTTPAALHVCEKLRPHLANLLGTAGFRALLTRALALASAEVHWLRAEQVKADGSLEGFATFEDQVDPGEFAEGSEVLVAQLLGLLVVFIGEKLTVQLVREVWPKLSLHDLDFAKGDKKNEKAK